jgi:hypothetical protein
VLLPEDGLTTVEELYRAHRNVYQKKYCQLTKCTYFVTPEIDAIINGRLDALKKMSNFAVPALPCELEGGILPDLLSCKTPLHFAIQYEQYEIVKFLLLHAQRHGDASIAKHQITVNNSSALHLVMSCQTRRVELLKLLLKHNCNVSVQDLDGNTPLSMAIEMDLQEEFELLLDAESEQKDQSPSRKLILVELRCLLGRHEKGDRKAEECIKLIKNLYTTHSQTELNDLFNLQISNDAELKAEVLMITNTPRYVQNILTEEMNNATKFKGLKVNYEGCNKAVEFGDKFHIYYTKYLLKAFNKKYPTFVRSPQYTKALDSFIEKFPDKNTN